MKNSNKFLVLEERHHDETANDYAIRRKSDYIWEVPEQLFLLRSKYFKTAKIIIDMGCGPAISIKRILLPLISSKAKYIGVDISRNMLKAARFNVPKGQFIHADIQKVKFKEAYADVIVSLGALHHALNKKETVINWLKTLKKGGFILFREPTYGALKRGEGESPAEEGIKVDELINYINLNGGRIVRITYFSTFAFHFFNRLMIGIGLSKWQDMKIIWFPITLSEVFFNKLLGNRGIFEGLSVILVVQKV